MIENAFVLLLGFPGAGKLTIALKLAAMLPARVIDNHWINNPILGLLQDDGHAIFPDAVWEQTAKVRQAVLDTVVTLCDPAANFVFTHSGTQEDSRSLMSFQQLQDAADRRNSLFVPIRLLCGEAELMRRVALPERREHLKSIDAKAACLRFRTSTVLEPNHPNGLTLDVTALSPEESAKLIYAHILDLAAKS